jgi:hypothetical protein
MRALGQTWRDAYHDGRSRKPLFQPDTREAHWALVLEATASAEQVCEDVVSMPAGPPE